MEWKKKEKESSTSNFRINAFREYLPNLNAPSFPLRLLYWSLFKTLEVPQARIATLICLFIFCMCLTLYGYPFCYSQTNHTPEPLRAYHQQDPISGHMFPPSFHDNQGHYGLDTREYMIKNGLKHIPNPYQGQFYNHDPSSSIYLNGGLNHRQNGHQGQYNGYENHPNIHLNNLPENLINSPSYNQHNFNKVPNGNLIGHAGQNEFHNQGNYYRNSRDLRKHSHDETYFDLKQKIDRFSNRPTHPQENSRSAVHNLLQNQHRRQELGGSPFLNSYDSHFGIRDAPPDYFSLHAAKGPVKKVDHRQSKHDPNLQLQNFRPPSENYHQDSHPGEDQKHKTDVHENNLQIDNRFHSNKNGKPFHELSPKSDNSHSTQHQINNGQHQDQMSSFHELSPKSDNSHSTQHQKDKRQHQDQMPTEIMKKEPSAPHLEKPLEIDEKKRYTGQIIFPKHEVTSQKVPTICRISFTNGTDCISKENVCIQMPTNLSCQDIEPKIKGCRNPEGYRVKVCLDLSQRFEDFEKEPDTGEMKYLQKEERESDSYAFKIYKSDLLFCGINGLRGEKCPLK